MGVHRIEDVVAWQLADEFKRSVYRIIRDHPAAAGDGRYSDHLRSSAVSASMSIAEGFYRFSARDFARHVTIALASLSEATLWLKEGVDRGYFTARRCDEAFMLAKRCRLATLKCRAALLESQREAEAQKPRTGGDGTSRRTRQMA